MFDPFRDFDTAGYLRNVERLKEPSQIKIAEHAIFRVNLQEALAYLASRRGDLLYADVLEVHRILFADFYPWAGNDRLELHVVSTITKGDNVQFEKSELLRPAFEWGLRLGNDVQSIRARPGQVMGAFAWSHPFLDGNGRTTLLIHAELCHRAGIAIDWPASRKGMYLDALTRELDDTKPGYLDAYFAPLVREARPREEWPTLYASMEGLDGAEIDEGITGYAEGDQRAEARYQEVKRQRGEVF